MKNVTAWLIVLVIGGACVAQSKSYKSHSSGGSRSDSSRPSETAAGAAAPDDGANPAWEAYRIVVERNIFMKDRGPRRVGGPPKVELTPEQKAEFDAKSAADKAVRDDPGNKLVLTGVALEGGKPVAFFEGEDGAVSRVAVGEVLAGRKVTDINLDQVHYERDGKRDMTVIGKTLTGKDAPDRAPAAAAEASGTPSTATDGSSSSGSSSGGSLAEKMKARREAELKGKSSGSSSKTSSKSKELEKKLKAEAEKAMQKDVGKDALKEMERAVKDADRDIRDIERTREREPDAERERDREP